MSDHGDVWVLNEANISSETAAGTDQWSVSTLHWPHRSVGLSWQLCPNRYPLLAVIARLLLAFSRQFTDRTYLVPHNNNTTTISHAPVRDTIGLGINTLGITAATALPEVLSDQPNKSSNCQKFTSSPPTRTPPTKGHEETYRPTISCPFQFIFINYI